MHLPGNERLFHKRQNGETTIPIPTAPGLSGGATAASESGASGTSLLVNDSSGPSTATSVPGLVSSTIDITTTPTSSPTSSAASSSSAAPSSADPISLGTVIGACVGAFVGFLFLVIVGVWYYNRSGKKGRRNGPRGGLPSPLSDSRNVRGNTERRRSRLEPWNRLAEKEVDVWEGMMPSPSTKAVIAFPEPAATPATQGGAEKLGNMFKSSPSLHSTNKSTSSDGHDGVDLADALAGSAQFVKYHPHLAEELAKTTTHVRPLNARQDTGPPISWDGETVHDDETFLSMPSGRIDSSHLSSASEAMSSTVVRPKNTPPATSSDPHLWESAEILEYREHVDEEAQNPFSDVEQERKSVNNPFFNAQGLLTRTRDPFADPARRPFTHGAADSTTSMSSTDRAMQSLIAALDISPEEVQERLRVASMQPSIQSNSSAMEDDANVVADFPLPPTQNRF